jgi:hypothetical protein
MKTRALIEETLVSRKQETIDSEQDFNKRSWSFLVLVVSPIA